MTARTLVILGGTGFFGKSFLDAFRRGLLARWNIARVVAIARQPETLRAAHPELLGSGVELVALDAAAGGDLPTADYLVHAANTTDARRYAADPIGERAAIIGAAAAFARSITRGGGEPRIVYTSSGAVYGQQPANVDGLDEDTPFTSIGALVAYKRDYAEAKRAAEAIVAELGLAGARVAVARCFAFIGPYLPRDQHFAVGNFLGDGLAGRPVVVKARHPVIRSYMHADDLVRWLMTIMDRAGSDCPIYNVGSNVGVDVACVAERIARQCSVTVQLPEQTARPVDRYVPATARAARELGLRLDLDLDAAIDATITRLKRDQLVRAGDSVTPPTERQL